MKIFKAYKFRIYPNKVQKEYFEKCFGVTRFVYNSTLNYKIKSYKKGIKYSSYDAIKDFTQIKKLEGYEWLNEINAQSIQQSILDLDRAFIKFFKEQKVGFPKFKKKGQKDSFRNQQNNKINFNIRKIKISKINWIKYRDKREFNGEIKNITISKNKCNQYFASILVEEEFEIRKNNYIQESKVFSADMSCKDFLVSSEMKFENQKFYRKNEKKLKIRQRNLSRKVKGSKNREKERLKIAKFHKKIVNERKGHQWNLVHELIQKFDVFCFEDLNIEGMKKFNKGISKTVTLDFSFSEFLNNLEWKCFKEDKHFVKIGRYFPSSKLCFECGSINKNLELSDRTYKCDCGYIEDRDLNASKNIKREGISILEKQGINLLKNSTDMNIFGKFTLVKYDYSLENQSKKSESFKLNGNS